MEKTEQTGAELLAKLVHEVSAMRNAIVRLGDRIEPFDDRDPGYCDDGRPEIKTNADVVEALRTLRKKLFACDYHLSAIRGRIEEIASNAILRDELQPWIKPAAPRKRE